MFMIIALLLQKYTEQNLPKLKSIAKILEEFQTWNSLVLRDTSPSHHPCVSTLKSPAIQNATEAPVPGLLGFHK